MTKSKIFILILISIIINSQDLFYKGYEYGAKISKIADIMYNVMNGM